MTTLRFPAKLLSFLLLGLVNNVQAIDKFDPATQTLTIPQVLVGTTTYNNVVLNLKDFSLVSIDPNPQTGITNSDFLMQFVSATLQGGQAKITFNLTSLGKDKEVEVGDDGELAKARFTDDQGNVYDPALVQVRNKSSQPPTRYIRYQFNADIPSTVVITYDNVPASAKSISLFDLKLFYSDAKFRIGNIPLQNLDSTPVFK